MFPVVQNRKTNQEKSRYNNQLEAHLADGLEGAQAVARVLQISLQLPRARVGRVGLDGGRVVAGMFRGVRDERGETGGRNGLRE